MAQIAQGLAPIAQTLRLVLVEDHRLFRDGLLSLLESRGHKVEGVAATAREGLRLTLETRPDVVVMDLNLQGEASVGAIREISSEQPDTRVLVMTGSGKGADVVDALLAGASGYLVKELLFDEMIAGIEAVARGEYVVSERGTRLLIERLRAMTSGVGEAPDSTGFTERELSILQLLARGQDNHTIAEALSLSVGSVKACLASLQEKLGATNRVETAVLAVRRGLA